MLDSADSAPRACLLAPIPAMEEAADLLAQAADCLLAGDTDGALRCLRVADMQTLREHASRAAQKTAICTPPSTR